MIDMTAEEFDRRFDEGEDIDILMPNAEILTMSEFNKIMKTRKEISSNSITIDLSTVLINKLKEKADGLNVQVDDLIKIILADRLGVLK